MKVTDKQLLELFQLKIGDVIKSSELKQYCDGIEFWVVENNSLLEEIRLYPLYKNEIKNSFGVGGISLNLLIGFEFEKVNDVSRVIFIKDMEYKECFDLYMWEDKLIELKPFFILCDNLIAIPEDDTMQDALNSLSEEFPASTSNLFTQVFQQLINKPYYNGDGNDYEPNSK